MGRGAGVRAAAAAGREHMGSGRVKTKCLLVFCIKHDCLGEATGQSFQTHFCGKCNADGILRARSTTSPPTTSPPPAGPPPARGHPWGHQQQVHQQQVYQQEGQQQGHQLYGLFDLLRNIWLRSSRNDPSR